MKYNSVLPGIGLYKVEFRILEIRISGETNLKMHFLSGNWIQKKSFKVPPKREESSYYAVSSNLTVKPHFNDSALHSNMHACALQTKLITCDGLLVYVLHAQA